MREHIRRKIDQELIARQTQKAREHFKLVNALEMTMEQCDRLRAALRLTEARGRALKAGTPASLAIPLDTSEVVVDGVHLNRQVHDDLVRHAERLGVPYQAFISKILHRYVE